MLPELLVATAMVLVTVLIHATWLLLLGRLTRREARAEASYSIQPLSLRGVAMIVTVVLGLFALHGF